MVVDVVVVVVVDVDVDVDVDVSPVRVLQLGTLMNYRNLDVYRKALRFLPLAAAIADAMPPRYAGLADQVRRASLSILLNIAEGSGKTSVPDQRRFYAMARGSAMECGAILDACVSLRVGEPSAAEEGNGLLADVVQMLSRMCRE